MNIPLSESRFYHIYNRANGNEKLFKEKDNYRFFIDKYKQHISPIAETYCYCLMPNHFHFLVRIRDEQEIAQALREDFPKFKTLESLLSKRFSNFFSSYTQAFNKQQNRMGSLFMKNFKRKQIDDMQYMKNLVRYIHQNPVEAGMVRSVEKYAHSSFKLICNRENDFVLANEVIAWFYNRENFLAQHLVKEKNFVLI